MKENVMMILAIIVFASVPMVQLVSADIVAGTTGHEPGVAGIQSLQYGPGIDALRSRFSVTDMKYLHIRDTGQTKQLSGQKIAALNELRNRTKSLPWALPPSQNSVFPSPVPSHGPAGSGVYLSDLDLTGEYVKITNGGNVNIVMTGWKICNQAGQSFSFIDYPLGNGAYFTYTLLPWSTVTIHTGTAGNPSSFDLYWPEEMWDDSGDTASLYNPEGVLVSTLSR